MEIKDDSKQGYVYILTNPSFREDWIKIGVSSRPVNVRSKELDNTAVPLPFEIYATLKTSSYDKVENLLHSILEGAHVRIRKNREFFNVKPEVALDAFYKISALLPDSIVYLRGEESHSANYHKMNLPSTSKGESATSLRTDFVPVHSSDDLIKGARYSLDKKSFYSMAKFGFVFIERLIADNNLSFFQLEKLFPKNMLSAFQYCGVVVRKQVLENSSYSLSVKNKAYHFENPDYILKAPIDGVDFYVTTQWERDSFKKLLGIAERHGYQVFTSKNNTKKVR